jgi:hypothetical protein
MPRFGSRFASLLAAATCAALAPGTMAQETVPQPRLNSVFPLGGKAGTDVDVTLTGDAIEGLQQQVVTSHPGITAAPVMTQPDRFFPEPRAVENRFTVKIAADVPPGVYEVRLANRMGVSNARSFAVGDLAETAEQEPNDAPEKASELAVNAVANGTCDVRGFDLYRIKAARGQRLIIHCAAQRLDAKTDPVLTLRDAGGTVLARARDAVGLDPVLDFTAPTDGEYVVAVNDFLYAGGPEYPYRLSVSSGPWIDFIDPPVAAPGAAAQHTLYGRNLPGSAPAEGVVGQDGKPLEKVAVTIQAPADVAAAAPAIDTVIRPAEAALHTFSYRLQSSGGWSNPVRLALAGGAAMPLAGEQEPNDAADKGQALTLPAQVLGRFAQPNDRDWYTFTAKAGEALWIEVTSERLGLPTNPTLVVQRVQLDDKGQPVLDPKGKPVVQDLAVSDDQPRPGQDPNETDPRRRVTSEDPGVLFTAPQDGTYRLLVKDLYGGAQAHPRFFYLLTVRPAQPDFGLVALLPRPDAAQPIVYPGGAVLRKGGSIPVEVIAFRREGFAGEIRLGADALPAGVTAPPAVIGPWADTTTLVLSAAADAAPAVATVNLVGKATVNGAEVARPARALEVVTKPEDANVRPRARVVGQFALAVRDDVPAAPASVVAGTPGQPIRMARGGKLSVPVKVARTGEFAGALQLTPVGLPPQMPAQPVAVEAGATDKTLDVEIANEAPLGAFTFVLRGDAVTKYTRSPEMAARAEADKVRAAQVLTESQTALQAAQQAAQTALQNQQAATTLLATATQQRDAATVALQQAQAAMQAADKQAADTKAAAEQAAAKAKQAADAAAAAAQAKTEADAAQAQSDAAAKAAADETAKVKTATETLATMEKARADAEAALKAATAANEAAVQTVAKTQQELNDATQRKQQLDQRAAEATALAQPKDMKFAVASPPVAVEIVASPFTLTVPALTIKAGAPEPVALPLTIAKEFGFDDVLTCELLPPTGVGGLSFADKGNLLPQGAAAGNLMIRADAATEPGTHAFQLRARYKFNNKDLFVDLLLAVTVTPPDAAQK